MISTNKAVHRIIASGKDTANIGRWCWTRFRGRNNVTLRVFSAYCPNSPTGPISVKAQQRRCFNGHNETRCPTVLFFKHLKEAIRDAQPEGHNILVMLGGNMYMKGSELATMLKSLNLRKPNCINLVTMVHQPSNAIIGEEPLTGYGSSIQ